VKIFGFGIPHLSEGARASRLGWLSNLKKGYLKSRLSTNGEYML
jgi:hypothetical protein